MRSKGTGSDDTGGQGRGWRARRRSADRPESATPTDPWDDDPWDDGWSDRSGAGRGSTGPLPQQVDAWLESDPDGGEITRDIAQRWTGTEIPPPGGTWSDDPVETWADDEPAEQVTPTAPAPRAAAPERTAAPTPTPPPRPTPVFESLDDEPDEEPEPAPSTPRWSESAVPTSLFAEPIDEPFDEPTPEPTAAGSTPAPAFDTHPFEEADTFAAEPPPATRTLAEPIFRPDWRASAAASAAPETRGTPAVGLPLGAQRVVRLVGTACVAVVAVRVLLTLASASRSIAGGVFLDRLPAVSGMHGAAYALALLLGVALLAVSRTEDGDGPAAALGIAITSGLVMLLGAVLSVRLELRTLDETGVGLDLVELANIGAEAIGPIGFSLAAAWAALRSTSDR